MKIEELSNYGIQEYFIQKFKEEGISELYPPQEEVIRKRLIKEKNLVISLPTAGGKTLIAALAIINKLSSSRCKAIYTVPLVALANEKYEYFKKLFGEKWKVAISVGDLDSSDPWLVEYDVIICTNEKLDSLIRHGAAWAKEIGLIVVDEIHLLNDPARGPTLEILLTQLREIVPEAQILALSATINNAKELAGWLDANLLSSDFRPVRLYEGVYYDSKIFFYNRKGYELSQLEPEAAIAENVLSLKKQALFFVATRKTTESLAEKLTKTVKPFIKRQEEIELQNLAKEILEVLETPTQQCKKLASCIKSGVAFHHAGLLGKQKRLIEDNFKKGLIKVIVATPTLCLHPETLVITMNGTKKISEVNKKDFVLTHQANFKRVISPLEREFNGELLVIKPFGNVEIKMTPEHRILVVKQTRHKSHFSNGSQKIWWEYDEPKWMKASEIYEALRKNKNNSISFMLLQPIPIANIKCDKICLKDENSQVYNQYGRTNKTHPTTERTPEYLPLNYEVSRLIGIWIAKGSTSKTGAIIFHTATYKENLTKFITITIKKYFPKAKVVIDEEKHTRNIIFYNKKFAEWLRKNIGNNVYSKKIPITLLFNQSREVRLGVFHGLLEGNGYVRVDNKKRTHYANNSTVSSSLSYQIQLLLASLGYVSYISKGEKSSNSLTRKRIFYNIKVGGKSFYNLLNELKIDLNQKPGNKSYNINKIWNNYLLLKIREVSKEKYSGKVYNLAIEDDESYSVGFVVHNSYGVNLPAFRVIIRDAKRYYPGIGAAYIPVLEYKQFVGRAGRPTYDEFGESVLIARTEEEAHELVDHFIMGQLEDIQSKLAVEPILRMHTLALIATNFCTSEKSLKRFFSKTFYAYQFGNISFLEEKISNILEQLIDWKFVVSKKDKLFATKIGKRVSELYIDPLTAHYFITALGRIDKEKIYPFGLLQLISNTIEMRPLLGVRTGEFSELEDVVVRREEELLQEIPDESEIEFDDFLRSVKTALMFEAWIEEATENEILVKFKVAPGEFYGRREIADWLIYSLQELVLLLGYKELLRHIRKVRMRLEYGVKEELIPLVRLKQVGRVRARKLFNSGIKSLADLRKVSIEKLSSIVGPTTAKIIKDQVEGRKEKKKIERQATLKKY